MVVTIFFRHGITGRLFYAPAVSRDDTGHKNGRGCIIFNEIINHTQGTAQAGKHKAVIQADNNKADGADGKN